MLSNHLLCYLLIDFKLHFYCCDILCFALYPYLSFVNHIEYFIITIFILFISLLCNQSGANISYIITDHSCLWFLSNICLYTISIIYHDSQSCFICITSNVLRSPPWGPVSLVVITIPSLPHSSLITELLIRVTRRVTLVKQELLPFLYTWGKARF